MLLTNIYPIFAFTKLKRVISNFFGEKITLNNVTLIEKMKQNKYIQYAII
jgi:hypothetical protein